MGIHLHARFHVVQKVLLLPLSISDLSPASSVASTRSVLFLRAGVIFRHRADGILLSSLNLIEQRAPIGIFTP